MSPGVPNVPPLLCLRCYQLESLDPTFSMIATRRLSWCLYWTLLAVWERITSR
ncbi:hypothetical protein DPMN_133494 [Dreissena polymorpha]|uniref:Uncharacterized protein n=1 Tax=Dreissena polymorpha TaxID=45954 RepID=A0A9D4FVG7_DREPO|nr:hypothetical protein DPMN_133494 [Dreissena polymorpha]